MYILKNTAHKTRSRKRRIGGASKRPIRTLNVAGLHIRPGRGATISDKTYGLNKEMIDEWAKIGVCKLLYVVDMETSEDQRYPSAYEPADGAEEPEPLEAEENLVAMKKDELIELCKGKGISIDPKDTKAVLITKLMEVDEEEGI